MAFGDVNGDGVLDTITGAGPGGGPHIEVFSGKDRSLLASFFAFGSSFRGGVFVAAGDFNGDGFADIIAGAGPGGGPHVVVFNGVDLSYLASFFAYDPMFRGGVSVAAGDVNGDGFDDIVTGAGPGAAPHVTVRSGPSLTYLASFYAYDPIFRGGVFVAAGDIDRDGYADIITGAGPGGGPHVTVRSALTLNYLASFYAYDPSFRGGVSVAAGDINGDGTPDIIAGAGPGGGPHVIAFDGSNLYYVASFLADAPTMTAGVWVGAYAGLHFVTSDEASLITFTGCPSMLSSFRVAASGPGRPTVSLTETLPPGLRADPQPDGSLVVTGCIASGFGGIYPLTFTATSGPTHSVIQHFRLTALEPPHFTSGDPPPFHVGSFGSATMTTAAYPGPATISPAFFVPGMWSPPLSSLSQTGLTLVDRGDGTATLSGTPTPDKVGTYLVPFYVGSSWATITITIAP
ncbi:MAG: VCBS repeat-containing protein [Vicinamibacterales bacterium]|nr:VCBS repeat-containing protein [Vicinamibacterales bacterium]